ncbi:MAG TPA: aminodeoxychorismate/anthranilate synthase component II, partial [Saprospiraceae bacterium]|nr:aminodeoxychorismate/anthranilate synthase component II [Saprospiraceae bacterium]
MTGIAIIDNYDSFTFNLVHLIREISGEPVMVMKNDEVNYEALSQLSHIVLSPGPGLPAESGQ